MNIHKHIKNKGFKRIKTVIPHDYISDGYVRKFYICDINTIIKEIESNRNFQFPIHLTDIPFNNQTNNIKITTLKNIATYKLDLGYIVIYMNIYKNKHFIFTNLIDGADYWSVNIKEYPNNSFNYNDLEFLMPTDVMKRNFSIENILK